MNAVRVANTALKELMTSKAVVATPARNYIACLTRANGRLRAKNTIIEQELNAISAVVIARKKRQSGKRSIIKGKHIVIGREMLDSILEAEKLMKERRQERPKRNSNRGAGDSPELTNEKAMEIDDGLPERMDVENAISS